MENEEVKVLQLFHVKLDDHACEIIARIPRSVDQLALSLCQLNVTRFADLLENNPHTVKICIWWSTICYLNRLLMWNLARFLCRC
jgi:hypothetical protein